MSQKLMNRPDRCCIYPARNRPSKIGKTRPEAQLLQMELLFPNEGVLLVLKFTASSSPIFCLQAHHIMLVNTFLLYTQF